MPILFECICGLRHEEYCGLNKKDIEFDKENWAIISITKAVTNANSSKVLKEPKTKSSYRYVVLHPKFVKYLKQNLSYMTTNNKLSDYPNPNNLTRSCKHFANTNKITHTPFGNMRSVYATLCSEAMCDDSIVSLSMGHSGWSTKQRNYQRITIPTLKTNAEKLTKYLFDL